VRRDVLAAIRHHDDGWAAWEQSPRVDLSSGRPLSFTEIEPLEAITIWNGSIAAAERAAGELAAWLVAGHFARLADRSDADRSARDLLAWRTDTGERRAAWLAAWHSRDQKAHTSEVAEAALEWVWTFDEVSLWLCCTCQPERPIPCAPEPYRAGQGTPLETELKLAAVGAATIEPWQFARDAVEITIEGSAVPAGRYATATELLAVAAPHRLIWRLSSPAPWPK
jgi:hypothetical protein